MANTTNLNVAKPISDQDAQKVPTYNSMADTYDAAIAGITTKNVAGSSNVTLTSGEASVPVLILTGALTGSIVVFIPVGAGTGRGRCPIVVNSTTGAFTVTVKTTAGGSTGIAVTQGKARFLYHDGTNVKDAITESGAAGSGDFSSNTSTSVDSEVVLFSGTGGKLGKRATGTGVAHLASGVLSASAVVESDLGLTDITTGNVSTSKHGFAPKLPNDATKYLDGTGAFSVPAGGGGGSFVGAALYNSSNFSLTGGGAANTLSWDTTLFDTSSFYAGGNPTRLTIPSTGKYLVHAQLYLAGGGAGYLQVVVKVNGSVNVINHVVPCASGLETSISPSRIYSFTASDYVEMIVYTSAGNPITAYAYSGAGTLFEIHKVG